MEKLYRKNRDKEDPADVHGRLTMSSITNRVAYWISNGALGPPFLHLMEAMQTGVIKHCHVIRFEDLTSNPLATLKKVYDYIEEPYFEHNFENVAQTTQEDDSQFLFYGDHTIRTKIEPLRPDYKEVLGKEVAQRIKDHNQEFYQAFYADLTR